MKKNYLLKSLAVMLLSIPAIFVSAQELTTLFGTVSYHNDGIRVLQNVTIKLYDAGGNLVATTITDENGYYEFPGLANGTYQLKPSSSEPAGGISVGSAIRIMKHINGQEALSAMGKLASDVNGDGLITTSDFGSVLSDYLVHGTPFPAGKWVFEEPIVEIDGLKSANREKGIGGSSTGDTGGAFIPVIMNDPIHFFTATEFVRVNNNEFALAIKASESFEMAGMHMVIDFPFQALELVNIYSPFGIFDYKVTESQVILSGADTYAQSAGFKRGDELVTFIVRPTNNFSSAKQISLSIDGASHFVHENFEKISPRITVPVIAAQHQQSALMANYPNPFAVQTTIRYNVAAESGVNISLFGLDGRLIATLINEYKAEGTYQFEFKRGNLNPGAYILRLQTTGLNPANDTRVMMITSD